MVTPTLMMLESADEPGVSSLITKSQPTLMVIVGLKVKFTPMPDW